MATSFSSFICEAVTCPCAASSSSRCSITSVTADAKTCALPRKSSISLQPRLRVIADPFCTERFSSVKQLSGRKSTLNGGSEPLSEPQLRRRNRLRHHRRTEILARHPSGGLRHCASNRFGQAGTDLRGQGARLAGEHSHFDAGLLLQLAQQVGCRQLVHGKIVQFDRGDFGRVDFEPLARL